MDYTVNTGDKYKSESGTIFIVDEVENDLVHCSIEGGAKGNYVDSLTDFLEIMKEEKAIKIN